MEFRNLSRFHTISIFGAFLLVGLSAWGCASVQSFSPEAKIVTISVTPNNASVQVAGTLKFTASVANTSNTEVAWHVNDVPGGEAVHGTIDALGLYKAPAVPPSPATVTIKAVVKAQPSKIATASVVVIAPTIGVAVSPSSAGVQTGKTLNLVATVQNDAGNKGITWTLTGAGCSAAACGTLSAAASASGTAVVYTAPASVPEPAAVTVTAQSVADTSKTAVSAITVTSAPTPGAAIVVSVDPASASVQIDKTQSLTAVVQNDVQNKGLTWTLTGAGCSGAACGTISTTTSGSGTAITYTAPASVPTPATVTVTAKSVADASKTASATLTVTTTSTPAAAIAVAVSPTTATVQTGKTQSFAATVHNDDKKKGVTWELSGTGCKGTTCGTLSSITSASGTAITYTAPSTVPSSATVKVTARSIADNNKTATATITITSTPTPTPTTISIAVNPTGAAVQTGKTQSIAATVQNDTQNKGVTWTLTGAGCTGTACGNLSATTTASGTSITYTAPTSVPTPATVTVTAKSVADNTKTATTTITITGAAPPPSGSVTVSITPKRVGLTTGQAQTFTATVSGSATTTATWEVDTIPGGSSSVGTISAGGTYAPPSSPGTHTVIARSVADTTVSASATVAITDLGGVFTYHNDLSRGGVNSKEYALTTSNVNGSTFGKRFGCGIDAAAYAQPLWVANVGIGGGTHNVVIAATQHDTVYAFDADATPCQTYWQKSLLGSGETWVNNGDVGTEDIAPDIGIVGTPVIDAGTNTIYLVSKSKSGGNFHQRLHALNLSDGSEKFSGPTEISFSGYGHSFDPLRENQRCGLALVNGVVYIAYASHGDHPTYYGWVVGYNASNLSQVNLFNVNPNSGYGGIWMSGAAPSADSSGNLYVTTGNGNWDGNSEFGDSFLKLSTGGGLGVTSYFTPNNENGLNSGDLDLGAGGAAILVDQNLVIGGGKEGTLYVLNRDDLGGKHGGDKSAVQSFSIGNAIFATAAFWQNTVYIAPVSDHLKAFNLNTSSGTFSTSSSSQSPGSFGFPGATPSVSSQGSSNGIVWAIQSAGSAVLHAYDATNLGSELWNSGGSAGGYVKFTVPTVANGKVYVGTSSEISVYGLLPN